MSAPKAETAASCIDRAGTILDEIISHEINTSEQCFLKPINRYRNIVADICPVIGVCIDTHHPTLMGRALIRWELDGEVNKQWLPMLHGMSLRDDDQVLVQTPKNGFEPIVIGVVDGYKRRPDIEMSSGPALSLQRDESITVTTEEGEKMLEIYRKESGPVVKLLSGDIDIELSNTLRISAQSIELNARQGEAKITANDDVVVEGEMIRLNS